MKRLIPLFAISALAFAFGGCTPPYPKCKEDAHCKDRPEKKTDKLVWCIKGQCVACRDARDCPEGEECDGSGACKEIAGYCSPTKPCADPKQVCRNNRCGPQCSPEFPCPAGQKCDGNVCVPDVECSADKPCPAGKVCKNGKCEEGPKCPGSCPAGQECNEGTGFKCSDIAGWCGPGKPCPAGQKCEGSKCVDATPPKPTCETKPVYFDFDQSDIRDDQKAALKDNATCIKERGGSYTVEGHCDERGTREYNIALGERRYKAAIEALKADGVDGSKLEGISHGKEKPACTDGKDECWSKNRRAEFKAK